MLRDARWNNLTWTRTNSYQISIIQLNKGKTGDWKNHFNPELNRRIDAWVESNLADTDLRFEMELAQQD